MTLEMVVNYLRYVISALWTYDIDQYVFPYLAELFDFLSLLNCSVDFILYCFMSSRYRQTFGHMLIRLESWIRHRNKSNHIPLSNRKNNNSSNASQIP